MKVHFIRFWHKNWGGQAKYTRSQCVLKELDESIVNYRMRYELGRQALKVLKGKNAVKKYHPLTKDNILSRWVMDYNGRAARKLGVVGVKEKHASRNWETATQPPKLSQSMSSTSASQHPLTQPLMSSSTASPQDPVEEPVDPEQQLYDTWVDDGDEREGAEKRRGSRRLMSWIWTASNVPTTDQDAYLCKCVFFSFCGCTLLISS